MSGNRKISGVAVPVTAALDPSFKAVMQQWPQMVRTAAGEASDYLATLTTKQAKVFQSAYDNYGNFVNQMNTKIITSMGRSGSATEAHLTQLMALKSMANSVGDTVNSIRLSNTIDFAEAMNLKSATKLLDEIQAKANNIMTGAFGKGMFVPTSAQAVGPFGHGAVSGMSTSAHSANENEAYQYRLIELADRQQNAEASREAERSKRQQFQLDLSRQQRDDATAAEQQRLASKYNAFGANGPASPRPPGTVPLSPAADAAMQEEFNAGRNRGQYDYNGSGGLGRMPGTVPLSPAALATMQAEFNASRVRGQYDYNGNGSLGPLPGTIPLSPAVQALRKDEQDQKWRNARADTGNIPGEEQRSRIFAESHRQEQEAERRRITEARAQAHTQRIANRQDRRIPNIIANERDHDDHDYMGDHDSSGDSSQVLQHRKFDRNGNVLYKRTRHGLVADGRTNGVKGKGLFGGLTKSGSHSARFAAQNVGFGIDDAIQSYHYGGAGASIRAASNNATAIAGMLISNPIIAAGAVVAISIASAALPIILRKFGMDKAFSDLTATERHESQYQKNMFSFSGGQHRNEQWVKDKETADLTWVANNKSKLFSRGMESDTALLKASLQKGGMTGFINSLADKQVAGGQKMRGNAEERRLLEADNVGLQMDANWTPTAKKELERNLSRLEELNKEDRVLNAERKVDAGTLERAKRLLPANLKQIASMSAFDRLTDNQFNRGDLTLFQHDKRLEERAAMERKAIRSNSTLGAEDQRAAMLRVDMQLMEDKANPDRERLLTLAQMDSRSNRRRFDNSLNPQNKYSSLSGQRLTDFETINRQMVDGGLSNDEGERRKRSIQLRYNSESARAREDDIDDLNPERNPLKRLARRSKRSTEDIMKMDIPEGVRRELLLANLRGTQRDAEEAMIPSGTRKYISHGYKIDSAEDEELRSRMTGNFGPAAKKEDYGNKKLDEIALALKELNERLALEAAKLGV